MARRIDGETYLVVFLLVCLGILMTVAFSVKYDAAKMARKRIEEERNRIRNEIRAKLVEKRRLEAEYHGLAEKKDQTLIERVARERGDMRPGEIALSIPRIDQTVIPSSGGTVVVETSPSWQAQLALILGKYRTPAFIIAMGLAMGILLWQPTRAKEIDDRR